MFAARVALDYFSRDVAMNVSGGPATPPSCQERLAIAGSGAIACGLAVVAARHGAVTLLARSLSSADAARRRIERDCERAGDIDPTGVCITTELDELADATVLVEAVVEDFDAKATVLTALASHAGDDAILATTTSSLSVNALALASGVPTHFGALHVFNPVPRMPLVELAFPAVAMRSVRGRLRALCTALGKTPVEVPAVPGFVVNRLLFPYLFNAVVLLERTGMAPSDVDACMTLGAAHTMGPLAVLDLVGLDVAAAIGDTLQLSVPRLVRSLVAEGALGRKSGRGLHYYDVTLGRAHEV